MKFSSTKLPIPMATTTLFFLFFFFLLTPFGASAVPSNLAGLEFLKVPPSEFVNSLKTVGDVLQDATSTLRFHLNNVNGFDRFRLSSTISTCLELLDLSVEELSWSVSAIENPQGKHNGTGNLSSDLRTWLSATLTNTDTCMDGFEDTNDNIKGLISTRIDKVNVLVQELLTKVNPDLNHSTGQSHFPSWVGSQDQKLLQTEAAAHVDAVVAADGTGNFTTVMDAVHAAPECSMKRHVIYLKRGIYVENVEIGKKKWNIMMIGESMDTTIISGNLSFSNNLTTFKTATFGVSGRGFMAQDISFKNTAGPKNKQAVALRSNSDLSVFYRCGIFGYQDSLYAHSLRQFYRECKICGTVDFICGHATAVFQNCQILVKKGLPPQKNTITAQGGGKDPIQPSGFSIQFCNISADFDLLPVVNSTQTYLGRPWKAHSRTIFMQSYISDVLRPEGWLEWNKTQYLDTLYYAEYKNYGPGAQLQNRVKWVNYHVMNDSRQATNFTVAQMILGDLWLPLTGVTFTPGFGDQNIA